jgi:hypothetical protein
VGASVIAWLLACTLSRFDLDADGWRTPADCDDHDHRVHPGALDTPYDGVDADCDGADDYDQDGDGVPFPSDCDDADPAVGGPDSLFLDADGDGYGASGSAAATCDDAGAVLVGGDCDDADAEIHPVDDDRVVATKPGDDGEICDDGVDQNCNGSADGCDLVGEFSADQGVAIEQEIRGGHVVAFAPDLGGAGINGIIAGGPEADKPGVTTLTWGDIRGSNWTERKFEPDADTTSAVGGDALAESGYAVASVPDVNGDGASDVLVGGPYAGAFAGTVWLLPGGQSRRLGEEDALAVLHGEDTIQFGSGLAAGDFDGDGAAELVVGANGYLGTCSGGKTPGITYIFSPATASGPDDALASFRGEACGDASGGAVANPGDLDGDGLDDLVVGTPNYGTSNDADQNDRGAVYVLYAPFAGDQVLDGGDGRIEGSAGVDDLSDTFGIAVAGAGDTDQDGHRDLVVGAQAGDDGDLEGSGAVYVFAGPEFPDDAAEATAVIYGEGDQNTFGASVAGGADVNRDGYDDVVAGAPNAAHGEASMTGRVGLVLGPMKGVGDLGDSDGRVYGEHGMDHLGSGVAMGDLDGDGHGDLILGADAHYVIFNNENGWVYAFFGGEL